MLRSDLVAFLASVLLSLLLTRWVRNFALARGEVDAPGADRHLHPRPVPRLGGVAIWLSFTIVVGIALLGPKFAPMPGFLPARTALGILGPALLVFLMGLYDDLRRLGPYGKFGVQSLAAVLLYFGGFGIQRMDLFSSGQVLRAAAGLPLTVLWVLLITNAFNLIDGLDGLAAGSALFSTLVLFVVSLPGGNHFVAFLAVALAGAIVGFLRYNFNPATIFLGDSGSLFIGFMLSALALAGSQKAPTAVAVAIPVVSFGLPILDVAIAVVRRFLSGKPLFRGDSEHIHHRLLKRGLSQRAAVLILYGVSALFGLLSLALLHAGGAIALVLVVLGIGVCMGVQQLKYHEFSELRSVVLRAVSQKRIIANDLNLRRAAESLEACAGFSELCRILRETLEPMGFDGFAFRLPAPRPLPDAFFVPLRRDADGGWRFSWATNGLVSGGLAPGDRREPAWELKLELTSSSGGPCGFFSVFKQSVGKPLLMHMDLLTDGFHAALAGAVHRALEQASSSEQLCEQKTASSKAQAASASR